MAWRIIGDRYRLGAGSQLIRSDICCYGGERYAVRDPRYKVRDAQRDFAWFTVHGGTWFTVHGTW